MPPARRSPDWAHTPCANMDLTRLRDEALRPAYAGQPVAYRAYSCREGAYLPPAQLPAQPLVILEGSYSHHPLLRSYETLRVFVTCTKAEQTRRLQAREGARYADFAARWVPLEEGYFAQYGIAESADGGRHLGVSAVAELDQVTAAPADHDAGQDQQQQDQQPAPQGRGLN